MPGKWDGKAADSVRAGALSTIADNSHEDSSSSWDSDSESEVSGRPGLADGSSDDEAGSVKTGAKQQDKPDRQLDTIHTDDEDDARVSGAKGTTGAKVIVVAKRRYSGTSMDAVRSSVRSSRVQSQLHKLCPRRETT